MADPELEELRKRKLQELQQQALMEQDARAHQDAQQETYESQKAAIMRQILTPEARERLGRVKIAYPDIAAGVEDQLIILAQSGRLPGKIDDRAMKQLLRKLMPQKREINIERR